MKKTLIYRETRIENHECTYALIVDGDRCLARGVSIRNPKDQFDRKKGVLIATGRAEKALTILTGKKHVFSWGNIDSKVTHHLCVASIERFPNLSAYERSMISASVKRDTDIGTS